MDSLKSSDWTTRKAASLALSSIAVSSGYLVASFRTSCLRSLERCKFDKVSTYVYCEVDAMTPFAYPTLMFVLPMIGKTGA